MTHGEGNFTPFMSIKSSRLTDTIVKSFMSITVQHLGILSFWELVL